MSWCLDIIPNLLSVYKWYHFKVTKGHYRCRKGGIRHEIPHGKSKVKRPSQSPFIPPPHKLLRRAVSGISTFLHNLHYVYNQFKVDLTEFRNRIALCNGFTSNFVLKHPIVEGSTSETRVGSPSWGIFNKMWVASIFAHSSYKGRREQKRQLSIW